MSAERPTRLAGVDLARALALLGMMAAHILPSSLDSGTRPNPWWQLVDGRASALFATLAGVGLALATGSNSPPTGQKLAGAGFGALVRALTLLLVGLALAELDSPPLVILVYYAVLFVAAVPFLSLRSPVLAGLAVLSCLLTPVLSQLIRSRVADPLVGMEITVDTPPATAVLELAVTGTYPALTWLTYLLAGLAVGRLRLTSTRTAVWLAGVGAVLGVGAWLLPRLLLDRLGGEAAITAATGSGTLDRALAYGLPGTTPPSSWWWLAVPAPHSGSTADLLHTTGTALLAIGCALLIVRIPAADAGLAPLAAAGSMTLTLYSAHVMSLTDDAGAGDRVGLYVAQVAAVVAAAALWRAQVGRGPLEAVTAQLVGRSRRLPLLR